MAFSKAHCKVKEFVVHSPFKSITRPLKALFAKCFRPISCRVCRTHRWGRSAGAAVAQYERSDLPLQIAGAPVIEWQLELVPALVLISAVVIDCGASDSPLNFPKLNNTEVKTTARSWPC